MLPSSSDIIFIKLIPLWFARDDLSPSSYIFTTTDLNQSQEVCASVSINTGILTNCDAHTSSTFMKENGDSPSDPDALT